MFERAYFILLKLREGFFFNESLTAVKPEGGGHRVDGHSP